MKRANGLTLFVSSTTSQKAGKSKTYAYTMKKLLLLTLWVLLQVNAVSAQLKTYTGPLGDWGTETYTYTEDADFKRTKNGKYTYTAKIDEPGMGTRTYLFTGSFKDGYRDGQWSFTITDVDFGGEYQGNSFTTGSEKWVCQYKEGYWIGTWTHTKTEKIRSKIYSYGSNTFSWGQYTTKPTVNETFKMPAKVTGPYKTEDMQGQYDSDGRRIGSWVIQNWESWKKDMPTSVETVEYTAGVMTYRKIKHNLGNGRTEIFSYKDGYPELVDTLIKIAEASGDFSTFTKDNPNIVSISSVGLPDLGAFSYAPIWQQEKIGGDRKMSYFIDRSVFVDHESIERFERAYKEALEDPQNKLKRLMDMMLASNPFMMNKARREKIDPLISKVEQGKANEELIREAKAEIPRIKKRVDEFRATFYQSRYSPKRNQLHDERREIEKSIDNSINEQHKKVFGRYDMDALQKRYSLNNPDQCRAALAEAQALESELTGSNSAKLKQYGEYLIVCNKVQPLLNKVEAAYISTEEKSASYDNPHVKKKVQVIEKEPLYITYAAFLAASSRTVESEKDLGKLIETVQKVVKVAEQMVKYRNGDTKELMKAIRKSSTAHDKIQVLVQHATS